MTDEAQIRELQRAWFRATVARDTATIGDLMTDDAIFLTPGKPRLVGESFWRRSQVYQTM